MATYHFGESLEADKELLTRVEQSYEEARLPRLRSTAEYADVRGPVSRALVWTDDMDGCAVVAIRGTTTEEDMAADQNTRLVPRNTDGEGISASFGAACGTSPVLVHAGFATALENLKQAGLTQAILRAVKGSRNKSTVIVTGHSLGGAIAMLLGLELARAHRLKATVVTWGAPQCGDGSWVKLVARENKRLHVTRVENSTDLICKMPKALAPLSPELPELETYAHVGEQARLDDLDVVDQLLQYLDRAIRAVASPETGWRLVGRISSHGLRAYRDNLESRGKPAFERMLEKAARVTAFFAAAAQVIVEAEEQRRREALQYAADLDRESFQQHEVVQGQPTSARKGAAASVADSGQASQQRSTPRFTEVRL